MYTRDLRRLQQRFLVRYRVRHADVECRRCHHVWTTMRQTIREPRVFWLVEPRSRQRPDDVGVLERHAARPH